jgi:hypothetical protein
MAAGVTQWVKDSLHDVLGYSDNSLAEFLLALGTFLASLLPTNL